MTLLPCDYRHFVLCPNAGMHFTISALTQLAESSHSPHLLKYFGAIDVFVEKVTKNTPTSRSVPLKVTTRTKRLDNERPISKSYDACLVGYASRSNEIAWQTELLYELLRAKVHVLCVTKTNTPQWNSFAKCLASFPAQQQRKNSSLTDIEIQFKPDRLSCEKMAMKDWQLFHEILKPMDLQVNPNAFNLFHRVAAMSENWSKLFSRVKFKSLVIRNNHAPENSSAAILAKTLGIHVFGFQHSVLTSIPSVCPTFADDFYCYGSTSQSILEKFSIPACGFEPKYRPVGMWNQPKLDLVPNFDAKRILLIDQECQWSKTYFGNATTYKQVHKAMGEILRGRSNIRWRIRVHFDSDRADLWDQLVHEFPDQVELSRACSKRFVEELDDTSLVVGMFSTAVCEAAKLGFPIIFLNDTTWFHTPDLEDFSSVTMGLEEFVKSCPGILNDYSTYDKTLKASIISANQYYFSQRMGLSSVAEDIKNGSCASTNV